MYRTCLYCNHDLGSNDALELLPIGRRLAFDSSAGRLWVICRGCARWNLVPFDTRLEVIDECERLFHDARKQFSTGNIGIARVGDGVDLVRIGPALRPEFAAWRYGDRFVSRRRRNIALASVGGLAIVGAYAGLHVLMGATVGGQFLFQGGAALLRRRIVARFVPEGEEEALTLTRSDVRDSEIIAAGHGPDEWHLRVPARSGVRGRWTFGRKPAHDYLFHGTAMFPALGKILPSIAGTAGTRRHVDAAVNMVEQGRAISAGRYAERALSSFDAPTRLALEMVANEASERRYLEGELKLLERQWRQAEELAAVADSLTVDEDAEAAFAKRRDGDGA